MSDTFCNSFGVTSGDISLTGYLKMLSGHARKVTSVTGATYTLLDADDIIHIKYTTTGTVALTIPEASAITVPSGSVRVFEILDHDGNANTNNITLSRSGSDTISGAATFVIDDDYENRSIMTDGSNWYLY